MSNILIEFEKESPTAKLTIASMQAIASNILVFRAVQTDAITEKDLSWCDAVISIRGNSIGAYRIASITKKFGRLHFAFYDDDLLSLNLEGTYAKRKLYVKKILQVTDRVLTTNPLIGDEYKEKFSKPYVLINTVVNESDICELGNRESIGKVKMVYAGNRQHAPFIVKVLQPIMERLSIELGSQLQIDFIGARPNLIYDPDKIEVNFLSGMPFDTYRKHMVAMHYDIGLSILHDNSFTIKKYYNKFIEYSIAGICGIYSNNMPYTMVVKNNVNGILCNNDPEQWFEAIKYLVNDKEKRISCVRKSQEFLRAHHSAKRVSDAFLSDIPALGSYKAVGRVKFNRCSLIMQQKIFTMREKLYKSWFFLKNQGVKSLWNKIVTHISDVKSYSEK